MDELKAPTRMSKEELKKSLMGLGYTEEQLKRANGTSMSRPELLVKYKTHLKGDSDIQNLDDFKEDEDDIGVAVESESDEPIETKEMSPSDPGWTQYVLGKFLEDEVDGQNPRVEGLRRVASELVGMLIEEGCDLVATPTSDNNFRACAKAWGVFVTPDGITKRFEALADAHGENCLEDYATYLVAMADTRAKGRMFRNALCLRRVVAAEEISKTIATSADIQSGGAIHEGQISMIRILVDRMKISITKLLNTLAVEYKVDEQSGEVNLKSLSYEDALRTTKYLNKLRQETVIPNELMESK